MTQRIAVVDPKTATGRTRELLDLAEEKFGRVPNILKTIANSEAALDGYLRLHQALDKGELPKTLREQIAIAIGEANNCDYCISAHTAIGKMAGLDESDVSAARQRKADDPKDEAALEFVHKMVLARGSVNDGDLANVRKAGYTEGQIVEIIANVALNTLTNYLNLTAHTAVDFPKVPATANANANIVTATPPAPPA